MEISFKNRRILITGGANGIGLGLVKYLVKQKAIVIALDCNKDALEKLKQEEPSVEIITADLRNWNETQQIIEKIEPVHHLVNNAAIVYTEPFFDIKEKSFDEMFKVNVGSVIAVSQIIAKKMVENHIEGTIVHISSQLAFCTQELAISYCATKAALESITKGMAKELSPFKIRVNSVCPTFVRTKLSEAFIDEKSLMDPVMNRILMKRVAEIDEVIYSVLFLLSDKSSMTTGSALLVDGGYLAS